MKMPAFLKNKFVIGGLALVLGGGAYAVIHARASTLPLQYVLSAAAKETVISSVSASGQVSGQNQIDLKPSVSGKILKVAVKPGDTVSTTATLFTIDSTDAQKTVRNAVQSVTNARLSVQTAELSLEKLKAPPEALSLIQSQNSLDQAKRALEALKRGADPEDIRQAQESYNLAAQKISLSSDGKTVNSVRDAYDATITNIKNVSQSLQSALRDIDDVLDEVSQGGSGGSYEYRRLLSTTDPNSSGANLYQSVQDSAAKLKPGADALTVTNADTAKIDEALVIARDSAASMSLFLQKVDDMLQATVATSNLSQSTLDSMRSTIRSDRSDVSGRISSMTSAIQSIQSAKTSYNNDLANVEKARAALDKLKQGPDADDLASAEDRVEEATASLAKLKQGATAIDIANAQNSLAQRRADLTSAQISLADAQAALADYSVHAPFDGVFATVPVKVGDQASPSTVLGSLLTKAKIVTVSLNEVDISKVKVGQKATITFDAVSDLSIAGEVSQIDTVGTVSQGVVTYNVKVAFLTEDERVKPGMSASVSIITSLRADVLTVPNAAIRTVGGQATVSVLKSGDTQPAAQGVTSLTAPEVRSVQTGLANDTVTEIVSGLAEGEMVVTRTIDPNAVTAAPATRTGTQGNTLGIPTGNAGFGGGGAGGFGGRGGGAVMIQR